MATHAGVALELGINRPNAAGKTSKVGRSRSRSRSRSRGRGRGRGFNVPKKKTGPKLAVLSLPQE